MKDKLRDLLGELMSACEMIGYATSGNERASHRSTRDQVKAELLALIDAEGDGGAVAEVIAGYSIKWLGPDYACSLAPGTKLYTHTARSGVVSDEELQAEAEAFAVRAGFTYGWDNLESGARRMAERAALEHFAKGERHER